MLHLCVNSRENCKITFHTSNSAVNYIHNSHTEVLMTKKFKVRSAINFGKLCTKLNGLVI